MMDMKDEVKMRGTQTMDHLFEKIDKICDDARDANHLGDGDVETLMHAWKTIHTIKATFTACGIAN